MDQSLPIIAFVLEKRKILISLFLIIGMFSATIFTVIIAQRPQDIRSKASESVDLPKLTTEFISPLRYYKLSYDQGRWTPVVKTDEAFGPRVVFNLNEEYGNARLDIIEGKSQKDLEALKNEIIEKSPTPSVKIEAVEFNGKPSYLISYKEEIIGQDVYYYQQIVKDGDNFFIFEKRAPQLGYDNALLDNLLQNISFTNSETEKVKGASDSPVDLSTVELVDLVRPSITNIIYVYCLKISNLQPASSYLSQPQYNFCGSQKGSGFIINEEGVVATNGHVAKVYPEEGLITNLLYMNNKAFSADLIKGVYLSKGQNPTESRIEAFYQQLNLNPQYLDRFLTEIFRMIKDKVINVEVVDEKYYVNVGNEPVKVDYRTNAIIPSSTTYTAKFIDSNYPNKYSYDAIVNKNYQRGHDVAILKIENSSNLFPTLKLGDVKNLREGSHIIIAGYPTLVEGNIDPRSAISYKTSTKPTITQGIVSSVKEDLTGSTILQTDASIDHGNSGGPAFNLGGEVIGIATFVAESKSGNFNFLREVNELKTLMSKNKIDNSLGKLSRLWRDGLESFRNKRYGKALKYFKQAQGLSPSHPTVGEFISLSQEAIAKGESMEGFNGFVKSEESSNVLLIVFGGISLSSFMSAGFLAILPLFAKRQPDLSKG